MIEYSGEANTNQSLHPRRVYNHNEGYMMTLLCAQGVGGEYTVH